MLEYKKLFIWKSNPLELKVFVSSLLTITIIFILILQNQYESRGKEIRIQGQNLIQILSALPINESTSDQSKKSTLKIITANNNNTNFLYAITFNMEGNPLIKTSVLAAYIPNAPLPPELLSMSGERILTDSVNNRKILELHEPINNNGNLSGYIRLGFVYPGFSIDNTQISLTFLIALVIVALTTFFYFLIKKEMRPVSNINNILRESINTDYFRTIENEKIGVLRNPINNFNDFIEQNKKHVMEVESDNFNMEVSNKILSFENSRLDAVLQTFPDGITILDEEGIIIFANTKMASLLDVKTSNLLHKKPFECFHNPKLLAFLSKYKGDVFSGYSNEAITFEQEKVNGKKIEVRVYPLFSPIDKSTVFGSLVIFKDVTQEVLLKASQGEFIAHVAHELKTPLNILTMYSETLLSEEGKKEEFRIEAVNVIHDEVERLSNLINNLLSITQIEIGSMITNKTRVKLLDLLQDAFDSISRSDQSKGTNFKLELPVSISSVSVDKNLLRIAINNLLTNAIKYNKTDGSVTLSAEETDKEIFIRIKDSGIGISKEDQQHIFEKFYRSDNDDVRDRSGHGLGLALAYEIIQSHQGTLTVDSTLGEGSEFIIEFIKDDSWIDKVI